MKKRLIAGVVGLALSAALLCIPAFASTDDGAVKEKREEIRQMQQERKAQAQTLRELVDKAREEAGIIPLTAEEKAILKAVKEEVLPLLEELRALKAEYRSAKVSGNTERMEAIRAEINELKAQIESKWDSVSEERAKARENREKANNSYRTESFAAGQKQRHELWQDAKDIREEIKDLISQIREAKAANDQAAAADLNGQLSIKLDELSQNISQRITVLESIIDGLAE